MNIEELTTNQRAELFNKIVNADKINKSVVTKLIREELTREKEYMVTFEGGGWNTVFAENLKAAEKAARRQFTGPYTTVEKVFLATKEGIESAMSNFY
jgi:hypothetical protein